MTTTTNSIKYTPHAVESFLRATSYPNKEFYLIDNNADYPHAHSDITCITRPSPYSFAQNANELAKIALKEKADLFFLNNDIIFSDSWLDPFIENNASIQIPSSNNQYQYTNPLLPLNFTMTLEEYLGKERVFSQLASQHMKRNIGLIQRHSCSYYAVHIPFSVLKRVGLFDERYAPYGWEDTDYTVRSYLEGIPLYINADSYILHFFGKSTWNKDGHERNTGDAHCAALFSEKWTPFLADLFGYQKEELTAPLYALSKHDLSIELRNIIYKSVQR